MNFSKRIWRSELIDDPSLGSNQLKEVFKDINQANRLLGGNNASLKMITSLIPKTTTKRISILDIGCGDGLLLRKLAILNRKRKMSCELYGLDNSTETIRIAKELSKDYPEIKYFCADILEDQTGIPVCDVVISALTMHHMPDGDIPHYLKKCTALASKGVIINDLHRSGLAYYLFMIFSFIFIRSAIAKKDGLLSIRKGFKKNELVKFSLPIEDWKHKIQWKWAFRYVWVMNRDRL